MQIWISNSRHTITCDRELFRVIRANLHERRGLRVADRFQSISALAELPWLDQPCILEPALFMMEIYAAWDELWTLRVGDLATRPRPDSTFKLDWGTRDLRENDESFGRYLAAPMHALASFTASTSGDCVVRASTHRQLIAGSERRLRNWRVLQGGRARRPAATPSLSNS